MLDIKIVEIGYFLSRCGVDGPPKQLKTKNWNAAILCFYEKLNNGKTQEQFYNSLKNVRDHFDSYLNNSRKGWHDDTGNPDRLPEQYLFILKYLEKLSDNDLWDYMKNYADLNNLDLDKKEVFWKFDVSTFRLLGRELITDRITALVELVKNSYDANAKNILIKFINTDNKNIGKIIICDDGFGMNSADIESKWMTIGTDSKRKEKYTPEPFNRRVVGEKGVGRFAIDKLGSHCRIFTKKIQDKQINVLTIDWNDYDNSKTNNFLAITNKLTKKQFIHKKSGVRFVINNLHDIWTNQDLNRVYKEMAKIVSPFNSLFPPFNITISSNIHDDYKNGKLVTNEAIKYASEKFLIDYDLKRQTQQSLIFKDNTLQIAEVPINNFGPVKFQLYYFNQYEKGNFSKNYHGAELQIDGIKIYRDGILATPFAEHQAEQNHQRDILGIDKRRWSGFFDKISSRDVIGIVEIKKDLSPNIIDATNRQDFIDNKDYYDLKEFIIGQIHQFEQYLKFKKTEVYKVVGENLEDAKEKIDGFSSDLKNLKNKLINQTSKVDIDREIKKLEDTARKANIALKQGIKKQNEEKQEAIYKESMYMSLMSLQTYALEITHIIKTSLGAIKRRSEFNLKHYGDEKYQDYTKKYNVEIMNEINKLDQAINFMSTYTKSEKNWEAFNITESIHGVFNSFNPIFEKENIEVQIEIQNNITLIYNAYLLEDIIKNLLNNSIKALKGLNNKLIKVSGYVEDKTLVIIFSDNGIGISDKNKDKIYEIYYTTTAEDGGNGMGLYMVKTNLEAVKGEIKLVESELDNGATFKLTFPFDNQGK